MGLALFVGFFPKPDIGHRTKVNIYSTSAEDVELINFSQNTAPLSLQTISSSFDNVLMPPAPLVIRVLWSWCV